MQPLWKPASKHSTRCYQFINSLSDFGSVLSSRHVKLHEEEGKKVVKPIGRLVPVR